MALHVEDSSLLLSLINNNEVTNAVANVMVNILTIRDRLNKYEVTVVFNTTAWIWCDLILIDRNKNVEVSKFVTGLDSASTRQKLKKKTSFFAKTINGPNWAKPVELAPSSF